MHRGQRTERQSNFELMRILAMLAIVAGHFFSQSGYMQVAIGFNRDVAIFLGSGSRIAVNLFLILGCWFMVDAKYKPQRVVKLYQQVFFWTVMVTISVVMLGFPVKTQDVVRGFIPFLSNAVWFASSYIALLLLSPYLHECLLWPQKKLAGMLVISFCLVSVFLTIWSFTETEDKWLDSLVWFSLVYLLVGYYKKYIDYGLCGKKWTLLFAGIVVYLILVAVNMATTHETGLYGRIHKMASAFIIDYKTVPNFAIACCFFYFFRHLQMPVIKVINKLASGAFSVYIVHQTPVIIPVIWSYGYRTTEWAESEFALIYAIGVIFSVYLLVAFVDILRIKYIENSFYIIIHRLMDGVANMLKTIVRC